MIELDRRDGRFGEIRIIERVSDGARLYCVGQGIQTMIDADGTSLFGYIHATKLLLGNCKNALLIGGGGGSLATMLARRGVDVVVVDIDPQAEDLARQHFQLDPRVTWLTMDAEAFIHTTSRQFEAVVIDACDAEGVAPPFATTSLLMRALLLVSPAGSLVLNLAGDGEPRASIWQLACEITEEGFDATLYRPALGDEGNELLHVTRVKLEEPFKPRNLVSRPVEVWPYLRSLIPFKPRLSRPSRLPPA